MSLLRSLLGVKPTSVPRYEMTLMTHRVIFLGSFAAMHSHLRKEKRRTMNAMSLIDTF
jgi:hypothetical protein